MPARTPIEAPGPEPGFGKLFKMFKLFNFIGNRLIFIGSQNVRSAFFFPFFCSFI